MDNNFQVDTSKQVKKDFLKKIEIPLGKMCIRDRPPSALSGCKACCNSPKKEGASDDGRGDLYG